MARRTHLTPEQRWTIICATPDVPDEVLALELGVTRSAVHNARWHFRHHGWSCRIVCATCAWCERPLVRRAKTMKPVVYHCDCRLQALRQINQRTDRRHWASMAEHERASIFRRLRDRDLTQHRETVARARSHGRRWTAADDRLLIEQADKPTHVLAATLGRTLFAVRTRRHILRQHGNDEARTDCLAP